MSLRPRESYQVPEETARVARARSLVKAGGRQPTAFTHDRGCLNVVRKM